MRAKENLAVVGCGVIGLTSAIGLAKAGFKVVAVSRDALADTTSAVAAACWYPYHAEPKDKVAVWAATTLARYREEESIEDAGIKWQDFSEYLNPESAIPWWHDTVDRFRWEEKLYDLPFGMRRICYYSVPVVDTSLYLKYLEKSLLDLGVQFVKADLSSIDDAFEYGETVVNCSGIGAIQLAGDNDLHPARGQAVRIKKKPCHRGVVDLTREPKIAHVFPRINDTVIGGTYEENKFELEPDEFETWEIIERCKSVLPELGDVPDEDILGVSCGLRPVRSSVRVECEEHARGKLFHNYGHGGAGFTLSWGCAEEIVALVRAAGA
jgi:D-amino-acid oxidase